MQYKLKINILVNSVFFDLKLWISKLYKPWVNQFLPCVWNKLWLKKSGSVSLLLETITNQMELTFEKSQHGFSKDKSCLTNLITFNKKETLSVHIGTAVCILCLDFKKAFYTVSFSLLLGKLTRERLDEWSSKWVGDCVTGHTQKEWESKNCAKFNKGRSCTWDYTTREPSTGKDLCDQGAVLLKVACSPSGPWIPF